VYVCACAFTFFLNQGLRYHLLERKDKNERFLREVEDMNFTTYFLR
jgi:hypothetical protein